VPFTLGAGPISHLGGPNRQAAGSGGIHHHYNKAKPVPEGLGSICHELPGPVPLRDFVLLWSRFLQECQAAVQKSGVPMRVPLFGQLFDQKLLRELPITQPQMFSMGEGADRNGTLRNCIGSTAW
jgi:hypothetical protein